MPTGIYQRSKTPEEYFWQRIRKNKNGCYVWIGSLTKGGYGTAKKGKFRTTAHRMSYIIFKGEIPNGYEIDHLCENTKCVNPNHLEAVTHLVNVKRGTRANQTHCINGHKFTKENTYIKPSNGCRSCKKCNAKRGKNFRKENPELVTKYEKRRQLNRKRRLKND